MINNNKDNYIRILINNIGSITKDNIDKNTFNIRFYYKTISSVSEKKINIYSEMEKNIPKKRSSDTKILKIRKLSLSADNYKPTYLDAALEYIPKLPQQLNRRPRLKYYLNLRGLLYFISLCSRTKTEDFKLINEMIEMICDQDRYIKLKEEVDMKCYGFKIEQYRAGELIKGQRKSEPPVPSNKPKVKDKFPFLSYYNYYKNSLPADYMVDFLYDIAFQYKDILKSKSIYD